MAALITLEHVTKQFDGTVAVRDLTMSIPEGAVFGLLGPSGSGKTTAVRLMIGVYAATSGEVRVLGMAPARWPTDVRQMVGYMPQISFLYPNLSVSDNLNFCASVYGLGWFSRRQRLRQLLDIVDLWDDRRKLVSQLSGGMRKRLSLACSLVQDPRLVFLDEPTAGIDPILRQRFWSYFRQLRDEGKTIMVTSHYVGEAEYCDVVAIIREGHLAALGAPIDLRRQALGGDAVDLVTAGLAAPILDIVRRAPGVRDVEALSLTTMRVYVDEAGAAVPKLAETLQAHGVNVEAMREYHPTFDEVFTRLVEKG